MDSWREVAQDMVGNSTVYEDQYTGQPQQTWNIPITWPYEIMPVKQYQGIYDLSKKSKCENKSNTAKNTQSAVIVFRSIENTLGVNVFT